MTKTQDEVVHDFLMGKTGSKASNLKTYELDDGRTALVGYDLAVYAIREDSEIKVFLGWDDHSKTTTAHLTKLRSHVEESFGFYMTGVGGKKRL